MEWKGGGEPGGMAADPNEILVFGYACKLFRDDDKAAWIEDERHLIPWMGDSSIKIDRYDGRGALMDISEGSGSDGVGHIEGSLLDQAQLEKLLEKERYRDLREDSEFDDGNYQEVEFRKFQFDVNSGGHRGEDSYAAVGYCYDEGPRDEGIGSRVTTVDKAEDERPYIKPLGLMMPPNVIVPPTMKLHSIIEKTAKFIAGHGSQMEIILKTKQSGNPLFNFLEYKDTLNPYFKYLVQAIRDNSYTPEQEASEVIEPVPKTSSADQEEGSSSDDDDGYLHPSLFRSSVVDTLTSLPALNFRPNTENSAYSLLVSKIQGSSNSGGTSSPTPPPPPVANSYVNYDAFNGVSSSSQYCAGSDVYSSDVYSMSGDNSFYYDPSVPQARPDSHVPNSSDQLVIEKMASYVVKNGLAFEELARTKGDPRFIFLNPSHVYHWYYLNCKERFSAETSAVVVNRNFVSYAFEGSNSKATSTTSGTILESGVVPKRIILKSVELPLSASGIPIANLESICSRPTSIPPEVASRIELIKKKNALFAKKESSPPKIQFSTAIGKTLTQVSDENNTTSVLQNSEPLSQLELTPDITVNLPSDAENNIPQVIHSNELEKSEQERLTKQMRRQKAALFLQQISAKSTVSDKPVSTINNNVENDANKVDKISLTPESTPLEENGAKSHERLSSHSPSPKAKNGKRSHRRSRSISPARSRSYSRSLSHSSDSSLSNVSSDLSRRKKRSKRRSSKKRKKKHDRDRSRSSSRSRRKSRKHKR